MEYRKLISFGKNSFVVSLPKNWVRQSKLKKGDLIYIEENNQKLILSKGDSEKGTEERQRVILIDGKSITLIEREINAAYIANCRNIILKGVELKSKIKELQRAIQNLIALEIMEQTSDVIYAKDFLNMDKVSIEELIRKMDVIARTMIKESSRIFAEDNYENINDRDRDVNRLYFLLYRAVLYNLEYPMKAFKNFNYMPVDLLKFHFIGFYIEGIADEVRRTARFARKISVSAHDKKQLEQFFDKVERYYTDTMKAIYAKDSELGLKLSELKKAYLTELEELERKNMQVPDFIKMLSRQRRLVSFVHNLGRTVYTLNYLPATR
ncbi:phosphate uptake regulator PhoU [Candidatus Woesearchaeota archaeon]|nr:phosphate uptake regulator PhoU [Candidatus Woesearchaeota archaeon]